MVAEADLGGGGDAREKEAQAIRGWRAAYSRMREEIGKVIIGQNDVVDQLLIAALQQGALPARRRPRARQDAARQHRSPRSCSSRFAGSSSRPT